MCQNGTYKQSTASKKQLAHHAQPSRGYIPEYTQTQHKKVPLDGGCQQL